MASTRPYYADRGLSAAFYDVVTASDAELAGDVEVYARLAPAGGGVLELGCGTGRIAEALAAHGLTVTGVDIAPAMLAQAESRRAAMPPDLAARIELRRGDMTSLDLHRSFDLVLAPYFTLAHVPAGAAWKNTFKVMARHLSPGGLAAAHLPLVEIMRLPAPPPETVVLDKPLASGGRLQLRVLERRFREDLNKLDQLIDYAELDARGEVVRRSAERLVYYVADPRPFAEHAGLTLDREPLPLGGVGEIFVFRKA